MKYAEKSRKKPGRGWAQWPLRVSCFGRVWWVREPSELTWLIGQLERGIIP